ncbi:hypothetical protein [Ligilactobacillus salivarius]|uniref:hypothetical protein n=1 Tax=Ligilactobacillus salivarius TaxID=1624 RepID=UPI000C1286D5|nr:hypothetical protein [Ligilactobacillus salivarius]ATP34745.1 hypothetical protein CR249_00030 [Ligilactobacillus salivarius]
MEPVLAVIVACIAYVIILFWLVGSRIFLQIGEIDMWCIYGILVCIAYAGSVDLYRLWKRKDDEK